MATLYRKYRPQTFADVFGQAHIKQTVQNEIARNHVAHAYLFCGPRGVGKTTMARLLAKAVNCLNRADGDSEPCNECDACTELMNGRSLDVIEIDAASHTGVDHVREHIINAARFVPNSRKYKVFIIDEVHMLSTAAFNALLKILEEPPEYVKFILATTEIHKILPTIISRCQRFDFKKITPEQLRERMHKLVAAESKSIDDEVFNIIIKNADGCLRDAESLLGQILILDQKHVTKEQASLVIPITDYMRAHEFIDSLALGDMKQAIIMVNDLVQNGVNIEIFTRDCIEYVRKIMLYSIHQDFGEFALDLDEHLQGQIKELSTRIEVTNLLRMVDVFLTALQDMKRSPLVQLPLELAVVKILAKLQAGQAPAVQPAVVQSAPPVTVAQPVATPEPKPAPAEEAPAPAPAAKSEPVASTITPSAEAAQLSLEQILRNWDAIIKEVQNTNYSLSCVFSAGIPQQYDGAALHLACRHKFTVDKITAPENQGILIEAFGKILGAKFNLVCYHDPTAPPKLPDDMSITMGELLKRNAAVNGLPANPHGGGQAAQPTAGGSDSGGDVDAILDLFGGEEAG